MSAPRNDNRAYNFTGVPFSVRPEYATIAAWIAEGSRVIDLGSGNGALMHYLIEKKKVRIEGVERAPSGVQQSQERGLQVRIAEIDLRETYAQYQDRAFDYAVCNVTLQMVLYPEVLLAEMARVASRVIVSFPNFAHLFNRLDLLISGRMPRPQLFGYRWFDTGHIHQLGVRDFLLFCRARSWRVIREKHMGRPVALANLWPSLFSRTSIYLCETEP